MNQRRSPTRCLRSFLAALFPILLKAPQTTPSTTITPLFPAYRLTGAFHHLVGGIATPTSSRLWPTRQDMSTMTLTRRTFSSTSLIQALCLTPSIFPSGLRLIHLQSVLPERESSRRSWALGPNPPLRTIIPAHTPTMQPMVSTRGAALHDQARIRRRQPPQRLQVHQLLALLAQRLLSPPSALRFSAF